MKYISSDMYYQLELKLFVIKEIKAVVRGWRDSKSIVSLPEKEGEIYIS